MSVLKSCFEAEVGLYGLYKIIMDKNANSLEIKKSSKISTLN